MPMLPGCVPWPPEFAARYRRDGYWSGEPLGVIARHWADVDGARVAVVAGTRSITYRELDARADRLASGLRQLGIAPHDRVVVQLPNVPEFLILSLALFRLGAMPVFALPSHRRSEIAHLCRMTAAAALVIPDIYQGFDHRALAEDIRGSVPSVRQVMVVGDAGGFTPIAAIDAAPVALPAVDADDVALFLVSGAPGAEPRLIPRTHNDYLYQLRATARVLEFDQRGVYLAALPIAHNAALGCPGVLGALLAGGTVVLAANPNPAEAFPLIERERITLTTLISPLLALWVRAAPLLGGRFPRLVVQVGGARLDPVLGRQVRPVLGCALSHWFGMAEGFLSHTQRDDDDEVVVNTQGFPLSPADEVLVVDPSGRAVKPGDVGEMLVRGPYTVRGYYQAADHNAVAFTDDGFLRTGDLVRRDSRGRIVVTGRIKDVVNRGGEKISALEVEQHLLAHPAVREAAVVAVPDTVLGERSCAFLAARGEPTTAEDVCAFLTNRGLAAFKLPDRIEWRTSLPRTSAGLIDKRVLAS